MKYCPSHMYISCANGVRTPVNEGSTPLAVEYPVENETHYYIEDMIDGSNRCGNDAIFAGYFCGDEDVWTICSKNCYCLGDGFLRSCRPGR